MLERFSFSHLDPLSVGVGVGLGGFLFLLTWQVSDLETIRLCVITAVLSV